MTANEGENRIHLYIATNNDLGQGYVGIGPLGRERDSHHGAVDRLLNHPKTDIQVTPDPFTTRRDAERAEAAAIRTAFSSGGGLWWLNKSASVTSKYLGPLFKVRAGVVHFDDLDSTIIAVIKDGTLRQRVAILAGTRQKKRDKRILRWWPSSVGAPTRFIAVSKARKNGAVRVLADYDILPPHSWKRKPRGWVIPRNLSTSFDPRGIVGMEFHWCGAHPSNRLTLSPDLRKIAGRGDQRRECGHPTGRPPRGEASE